MPDAPPRIRELVETFARNIETYRSGQYNEAQVRREFIDPFFIELGWDVHNEQGYAHAYKHVIHEDALKVGAATKAPDYSFRIGGVRKFFLEAKKPSIDIKGDPHPAYQLRRYAWSAKLPLSILTDFEEFAVYDCRTRPRPTDRASASRILFIRYDEYPKRWHEIAAIFSREAVLKGSFDKFAQSRRQKGTAEVDVAFLAEIEKWRDMLARNIALRNPHLTGRQLNFAVQATIDRIIFLRMCEDRGIESYAGLQSILPGDRIYQRLCERFETADRLYNSGLFHFEAEKGRTTPPDELTPALNIDDKDLKYILQSLYYPQCPYEFSVLPPEILGNVYEQFLGKVITLTSGHRARIEEKPEVKKAGGVYYTPSYIVDYIVQNTVGKLIEGRTPRQVADLRILDPACGSGSFLLGAYTRLLDWHRDWYTDNDPESWARRKKPPIRQIDTPLGPAWVLTVAEKKRILLNNIFGVDIDSQAVEVTKLSLLLKVLEGETAETLGSTRKLFHERALPDLGDNIKCGNSLIAPDFFDTLDPKTITDDLREKVNAFDWKTEFPGIFKRKDPGFDAVIGNPPYLFITEVEDRFRRYFERRYTVITYRFDLYGAFVEKSVRELLGKGGLFGFIIPHTLLSNDSFRSLRQLLAEHAHIHQVVDIGPGVFAAARNETMLLFFRNLPARASDFVTVINTTVQAWPQTTSQFEVLQSEWARGDGDVWLVRVNGPQTRFLARMTGMDGRLGDFCTANQGLRTGDNQKYLADKSRGKKWKKAAGGRQVSRYAPIPDCLYVLYEPSLLDAPRRPEIFFGPSKIIVQEIRNITLPRRLVATLDNDGIIGLQSTNVVNRRDDSPLDIRYVLGLLNSAVVNTFFRLVYPGNNHIPSKQLLQIPVPLPRNTSIHDRMVALVQTMLDLHKSLQTARTPHEQTTLKRQIAATDGKIDQLTYELYNLTDEEIAIIEQSTSRE